MCCVVSAVSVATIAVVAIVTAGTHRQLWSVHYWSNESTYSYKFERKRRKLKRHYNRMCDRTNFACHLLKVHYCNHGNGIILSEEKKTHRTDRGGEEHTSNSSADSSQTFSNCFFYFCFFFFLFHVFLVVPIFCYSLSFLFCFGAHEKKTARQKLIKQKHIGLNTIRSISKICQRNHKLCKITI